MMSTSAGNKRGHDQRSSNSESCGSNAVQFKIDPKTGEQFKYSREVDEWELTKFIIVESLYSKSFRDSLEKYIQIFYYPAEYSEEIDRAELVKFICSESILYTTSFKNSLTIYIRNAHFPACKPIPRSVVISEIRNQFRLYQRQIIENLKSLSCKVSLGIDIAHTDLQVDVSCITAHWIDDDFIMHKRILGYRTGLRDEFQDGGTIGKMMSKFSRRYWFSNKFFSFNSYFKENTNESAVKGLKHRYVKCACHILNSIVTDGMSHFDPEIWKIRKAIRYIKSCSYRETEFSLRCLDDNNHVLKYLILDIPTRWNTTYDMLVRAVEHKAIVTEAYNESIVDDDENGVNNIDWTICEEIVNFLKKIHNANLHFSGSYYPTCNSALVYLNDISSLFFKYKDNPFFSDFLHEKRAKFIKHFIPVPPIYLLGALLDPMMKLQHIELSLKCLYQNLDLNYSEQDLISHKEELLNLANEIYSGYEVSMPPSSSSSTSSSKRFPGCEFWQQQVVMSHESRRSSNSNELSLYLEKNFDIDESDFDLLAWWKENTKKFPVLSRMARDVLAVPVSTIPSDRVFSGDAVQIWERENLLGDSWVEMVECLKDWIRAERRTQGSEEIDSDFLKDLETEFEGKCNMADDDVTEFSESEVNELLSKFQ